MPVRVTCPNPDCRAAANVEEQSLGRRGRCKKCGHIFALARPDGGSASAMSDNASAWKGSAPASPTNLPEQFGRYRIMKPLGQGGMGAVYLALDTKLDRQVALKVPFFHPSDGPQAVQRFEREARAAANLDHPNLCPVYDVGEIDGIHYLTMPYIEGKPLSEAIATDQTFTELQAAAVTRKLALALQEAHAGGVVHRDLKPANIMIKKGRDLVIMDFGLARMVGGDEDNPLTRTGHVLGTALYMAPEQAAGDIKATGPACDVYSLGVILYELLTGLRPFEGPWSLVIGLKNVRDPDPPSKHLPKLSPNIDAICLKAIARDPKDRYASMVEFAEALSGFPAVMPGPNSSRNSSRTSGRTERIDSLAPQALAEIVSKEVTRPRKAEGFSRPRISVPDHGASRQSRLPWIISAVTTVALPLGIVLYATNANRQTKPESKSNNPSQSRKNQPPRLAVEEQEKKDGVKKRDEGEAFQGIWHGVLNITDGVELTVVPYENWTTERRGDQIVTKKDGEFYNSGTWVLDSSKNPMEFSLTIEAGQRAGAVILGIVKREGNDMVSCSGLTRPTAFESLPGQSFLLTRAEKVSGSLKPHEGTREVWKPKVVTGDWQIQGDELVQTSMKQAARLILGNPNRKNYDIRLDTMAESGHGTMYIHANYHNEVVS